MVFIVSCRLDGHVAKLRSSTWKYRIKLVLFDVACNIVRGDGGALNKR